MSNKNIFITAIVALAFTGAGFFGGIQYQKKQKVTFQPGIMMGTRDIQEGVRPRNTMQPISGDIMAIDDKSLTVKTADGSSKIVIYSGTTKINRTTEGVVSDLKIGEKVMVIGNTGTDGTVTAQNISVGGTFGIRMP